MLSTENTFKKNVKGKNKFYGIDHIYRIQLFIKYNKQQYRDISEELPTQLISLKSLLGHF